MSARRRALFLFMCMPLRLCIAAYAGQGPVMRTGAAVIGGRWLLGYEKGTIGVFGGPAWWKEERGVHGVLWTSYAITGNSQYLWIDAVFGALNWLDHYFRPSEGGG